MTSRTFSTLDPNRIGDGLSLSMGNLIVSTSADDLDNHRKVLGTVPRGTGTAYFECYFYSDTQPDGLISTCSVGVATVDSDLDAYVGEDANSYGFVVGTGEIQNSGVAIETVNAQAERICIGVLLRADSSSYASPSVSFSVNGNLVYAVTLPAGKFWVPAVTVSGMAADDMSAFVNFGQRGFDHPSVVVD